jgi:transcription elongation factor Elf1
MKPTEEYPLVDGMRYHMTCTRCGEGEYEELSLEDDWDGKLTCTNCGKRVNARTDKEE